MKSLYFFLFLGLLGCSNSITQDEFDQKLEDYFERKGTKLIDRYLDEVVDYRREQKRLGEEPEILEALNNPVEGAFTKSIPTQGPKNAPLKLVLFMDYESPYSERAYRSIKSLYEDFYTGTIEWGIRLSTITNGKNSKRAALAALAADEQGKFWEMTDLLLLNQHRLSEEDLLRYARSLRLDIKKFNHDRNSEGIIKRLKKDQKVMAEKDWDMVPIVIVNGGVFPGARSKTRFEYLFETALKQLKDSQDDPASD